MPDQPLYDGYDEEAPEGDIRPLEAMTPEEAARSQQLFNQLAAEEPPLDLHNDTAPSKTAPRPAQHTRPIAAMRDSSGQFIITLLLGVALVVTLVATLVVFFSSGDDDGNEILSQNPTATLTISAPTSTLPNVAATPVPTESAPQATIEAEPFVVSLPPTAAADEVGAWLLTPLPNFGSGGTSLVRQDGAFTIAGQTPRLEVTPYTVRQGDTLTDIGVRFGLDICSIVWSNPRNKVSPLRPGNVIDILPVDGVLFKVSSPITIQQIGEQTGIDPFIIIDSPFNDLFGTTPDTVLVEGMKIVVPGGDGGNCNIWSPPTVARSGSTGGSGSSGGVGPGSLWGCAYTLEGGGFAGITPVNGKYTFFQGYTAAHTGVDLAAASGTPVVSAGSGTVAFAGWNEYGYGNAIVIDHGGVFTLYAHLSSMNVSCGQVVGAGDYIGAVGSTGRSSGPHLHFEIRDSGFNPMDPVFSLAL